ncbi:MAG: hypothetical protein ABSD74_20180 [Rhizomicrobium sp.]|jgi:hypothetical protein
MDRRYYGLKAMVIGVAVAAAILGGGFECTRLAAAQNANYQAAFVVQSSIRDAGVNAGHSIRAFVWRVYNSL